MLSVACLIYYSSIGDFERLPKVRSVAAGGFHTCTVLEDPQGHLLVKCFGDNLSGQLGLGLSPGSRDRPTGYIQLGDEDGEQPSELPAVDLGDVARDVDSVNLGAGQYHTCAILAPSGGGRETITKCWGSNGLRWGQLGLGNQTLTSVGKEPKDMGNNLAPLKMPARSGHGEQISASYGHSCVRLNTSQVACWGLNEFAQLGIGDKVNRHAPVLMTRNEVAHVVQVEAGYTHTCALLEDGSVKCWGGNGHGQLGGGDNRQTAAGEHIEVDLSEDASSLALGSIFGCALLRSGNVECWGNLSWVGSEEVSSAVVEFGSPAVQVTAGRSHVCALLEDRTVYCLGKNDRGQLGCDRQDKVVETPCKAAGNVLQIDAGDEHTCAVRQDHSLICWGGNSKGQLGQGDKAKRRRPAAVAL